MIEESVILGEKFFFDKGLSVNKVVLCSSCYELEYVFFEFKMVLVGVNGDVLNCNVLVLVNVVYNVFFIWVYNNLESIEK